MLWQILAGNKINLISVLVEFTVCWKGLSHTYYKLLILEIIIWKERLGSGSKIQKGRMLLRYFLETLSRKSGVWIIRFSWPLPKNACLLRVHDCSVSTIKRLIIVYVEYHASLVINETKVYINRARQSLNNKYMMIIFLLTRQAVLYDCIFSSVA